jgi:hypothetical protein
MLIICHLLLTSNSATLIVVKIQKKIHQVKLIKPALRVADEPSPLAITAFFVS